MCNMEIRCTDENFIIVLSFCSQALHCKNMQKARELWDSIMTKGNAKYANMWLEYYNLERSVSAHLEEERGSWSLVTSHLTKISLFCFPYCFTCRSYGDPVHCRKALHRAVQCTSDYPEHVCEVLLTFERVEGESQNRNKSKGYKLNSHKLQSVHIWCPRMQVLWRTGMQRCWRQRRGWTGLMSSEQRWEHMRHISAALWCGITQLLSANVTMLCPSVRRRRRRPTWLAKRRRGLTSGGKPRQTRKLRRRSKRELDSARRGKLSRTMIGTNGMKTLVRYTTLVSML